jgi:hypothetical protein
LNEDEKEQTEPGGSKSPAAGRRPDAHDRDDVAAEIERETERAADAPITDSSSEDSRS